MLIILLTATIAGVWSARASEGSARQVAEYMIYQYPDVSMVVKIDVAEVEFDSKIYGPENALISSSGIPSGRIGPLYQYIDAADIPRQLMIKINTESKVDRSRIKLELIQLPPGDRNSAAFARAYQLLSSGTQSEHSNDTTTWAMKIYTLKNAAQAFASLGWEEMQLWSGYYAAHLVLYKLNDELMAMEFAGEIQDQARRAGFGMIELAALILEGESLMIGGADSSGKLGNSRFEQAHGVWDRVVLLTDQLGLRSEQARALFNDGLAYQQQDRLGAAIGQFQRALDVSLATEDSDLVNQIRSTAAAAYETQGSTSGAIEMLDDIGSDVVGDAGQELVDTLYEKGRILNSIYRYPEASAELEQALALQKSDARLKPWGPTGLALAWSYYSMGDMEQAAGLVAESIPRTSQAANTGALIRAYDSLAHIYRDREQYRQMSQYREKQADLTDSEKLSVGFLFESALDAWRRDGPRSAQARELLNESRQLARASGDALAGHRAAVFLCLLRLEQNGRGACTAAGVRQSHDALRRSGIPVLALDADFVQAKILRREGRDREALSVMEGLIDEVLFYRQSLPGLLGAWYWQNKEEIFEEYMAITLAQSYSNAGTTDGRQALLALDRIRWVERTDEFDGENRFAGGGQDEVLRTLLSRMDTASGTESAGLAGQLNTQLLKLREQFDPEVRPLDSTSLEELLAGLGQDETVLTYYFSESDAYALLGNRTGVSLVKLGGTESISARLGKLRRQIGRDDPLSLPGLNAMGRLLLQPVSGSLTRKIFLLPMGPLLGFPFDLLRLDGHYLLEKHNVINLMSLENAARHKQPLAQDYKRSVFLAGNPQIGQELFSYDVQVSSEIATLTDIFVGPGLHIVQGVALKTDEFQDTRLTGAALIHLAIPGAIDLAFAERSRLLMSGAGGDSAAEYLVPGDIGTLEFDAGLAVLSRTEVVASSRSSFDSRLGFVSEFLEAGASHVVVSLWSRGDSGTAAFMREFYSDLEASRDVSEALLRTRMRRMDSSDTANFNTWAGFQLYIR